MAKKIYPPDWERQFEILFHGTKFKYNADRILKEGFEIRSYFARNVQDAVEFGGKYVFEVVFHKDELPDNWQVKCCNPVSPDRITRLTKVESSDVFVNKTLLSQVCDNAIELESHTPYHIIEDGKLSEILKIRNTQKK